MNKAIHLACKYVPFEHLATAAYYHLYREAKRLPTAMVGGYRQKK